MKKIPFPQSWFIHASSKIISKTFTQHWNCKRLSKISKNPFLNIGLLKVNVTMGMKEVFLERLYYNGNLLNYKKIFVVSSIKYSWIVSEALYVINKGNFDIYKWLWYFKSYKLFIFIIKNRPYSLTHVVCYCTTSRLRNNYNISNSFHIFSKSQLIISRYKILIKLNI